MKYRSVLQAQSKQLCRGSRSLRRIPKVWCHQSELLVDSQYSASVRFMLIGAKKQRLLLYSEKKSN